jgi:cephalosporin hydroxylase
MKTDKDTIIKISTSGNEESFKLYSKKGFKKLTEIYMKSSTENRIMYEPRWLGINIIQLPNDMIAMQECIWDYKPDMIIETGVALGGSLIYYASIMKNYSENFNVIGIDIKIYPKNKKKILSHPLSENISLVIGSSIEKKTIDSLKKLIKEKKPKRVLISLDSNHEYSHVVAELNIYSKFIKRGGMLIVQDAAMDDIADIPSAKPNWKSKGPKAAISEFIKKENGSYVVEDKLNRFGITASPSGFLKRIS